MSGKYEHRRRQNMKLRYIAAFFTWLSKEPPMILFWRWRQWKKWRPVWDESGDFWPHIKEMDRVMKQHQEDLQNAQDRADAYFLTMTTFTMTQED